MRILHYIPRDVMADETNKRFVSALQTCLERYEPLTSVGSVAECRGRLHDDNVDIVHLFGCWNHSSYRVMRMAMSRKLPVVLSPMSMLMPWHLHHRYLTQKMPARMAYQKKMVEQADALHAWSEMELAHLQAIHYERVQLVPNSTVTRTVTPEQMTLRMVAFYQKVIDSNTFRLMSDQEKTAETLLLRKGLARDAFCSQMADEELQMLRSLTDDSWRKILIHAADEDITDAVCRGGEELNLSGIHTPTDTVDRFPQKLHKPKGDLSVDELASRNPLTKSTLDNLRIDEKPTSTEMELCMLMHNLQYMLRHQVVTRRYLSQAYSLFRFGQYDEDKLERMLRRLKLDKFAARLLCILDETFAMTEGFMPLQPIDDGQTEQLRRTLRDMNVQ